MEEFTENWLATRELEDKACRSTEILDRIEKILNEFELLKILDIGCGTGSTMRSLLPRFSQQQHWHLVDNDPVLLKRAKELNYPLLENTQHKLIFSQQNLAEGFDFLNGDFNFVTTSAFLDLVSENWMCGLIQALSSRSTVFYSALTVGNTIEIKPYNQLDDKILTAFKNHQCTDKGFGPALGPDANMVMKKLFECAGYETHSCEYYWGVQHNLDYNRKELYPMFLSGIVSAVEETKQVDLEEISDWYRSRIDSVYAETCEIRVLHEDLLAVPGRQLMP